MIKVVKMVECIEGYIKCCIETEMILPPSDVKRIHSAGFSKSYFCRWKRAETASVAYVTCDGFVIKAL